MTLDIAIQTPPEHAPFEALAEMWAAADELGFAAAFTFDHLVPLNTGDRPGAAGEPPPGPQLDGWVSLAALAAHTRRIRVGTLVSGVTYRHPAVLAKMAVTLDRTTGGRAILGLGAAWHAAEHEMYGIELPPVGRRVTLLEETVRAFRALCEQDRTTFTGRELALRDAPFEPKPVHGRMPVLIGGSGDRITRIAARHADLFNSFYPPWQWAGANARLDKLLIEAGRQPAALTRSAFVFCELTDDQARQDELVAHVRRTRGGTDDEVRNRVVAGTPDDMVRVLRAYETAGVQLVVLNLRPPHDPAALERFARDVLPQVASAATDRQGRTR